VTGALPRLMTTQRLAVDESVDLARFVAVLFGASVCGLSQVAPAKHGPGDGHQDGADNQRSQKCGEGGAFR
jgi:hypothetical protein